MKRIGKSIDGGTIDLDTLRFFDKWEVYNDKVRLFGKDGNIIATVNINTLITCWIEKEEEQYKAVKSASHN